MSKALSQTSTPSMPHPGLLADFDQEAIYDRSIVIDDSYDDQTEILTVMSLRIARGEYL